jgi:hypothetical protein
MFEAKKITVYNMPENLDPKDKITFIEFHNDEKILLAAVYLKRKKVFTEVSNKDCQLLISRYEKEFPTQEMIQVHSKILLDIDFIIKHCEDLNIPSKFADLKTYLIEQAEEDNPAVL